MIIRLPKSKSNNRGIPASRKETLLKFLSAANINVIKIKKQVLPENISNKRVTMQPKTLGRVDLKRLRKAEFFFEVSRITQLRIEEIGELITSPNSLIPTKHEFGRIDIEIVSLK